MPIFGKLRSVIGATAQEKRYRYACSDCGDEFESTVANPNRTECPTCGSDRIISAP